APRAAVPPRARRFGAGGWDRAPHGASARAGEAAQRWPADGGGEPGWPTCVPDEFAVQPVGRAVLPGRRPRLAREAQRGAHGRARARSELLPRVRGRDAAAPGAAPGRRRVVRLLLLFVSRAMPTNAWAAAGALVSVGALHGLNAALGWLG